MTRVEQLGRVGVWGHLDSLPATQLRGYAVRIAELGLGALWVPETVGREPFALLAWVAEAAGERMWLGTGIAAIYSRDAVTMKTGAMTLHELTAGRFVLGLGVSHPHLVTKVRGHDYERPVSTMRAYLAAYRAAPWRGPELPGTGAGTEPPIVIAALREGMLTLAATDADGAFPYLVTAERVAWMRTILDRAVPPGRPRPWLLVTVPVIAEIDPVRSRATARAWLVPYLRAPNYQASWTEQGFGPEDWAQPGSDRLVDAMVAWGDPAELHARIRGMHAAGADHVALIPLGPDGTDEYLPTLEVLAARPSR
jgi:probable F420-dependent oxidoreductase